ncbi:hypothetical protein LQ318_14210 [Aliifodinibius salicampi]|uniref:5-bromo-4-chloroindolyl phosphate hydrolysis protein n=1 Tax=Fodinibius salicampi TaxID=1920655 RepID=A0ABT3Q1Q6_9BACT|nr:hypothetical protein [Fodinibius salicampi]MCW9714062.1 hypothetical protein [Fodinibius salicampi]
MSEEETINFTREAFLHPINLGMLLVAAISAFAMSGMGSVASLTLTIAFGVELMYLGIVPRLPRFRKNVKFRKLHEKDATDDKTIFHELDRKSQKRFLSLKHLTKLIKENFDKLPYSSQGLLENIRDKIEDLSSNYLNLLDLHKRYQLYMNTSVEERLKAEVEKEERKMEDMDSDRLKETTARRVAILRKRLKKFEVAKENYLICETHIETIEDAIQYIYEQSMTMSDPEEIGLQLDNLLDEVEETSQLIDDMDREILPFHSDIGGIDLDAEFREMEKEQQESNVSSSKRVKE